MGQLNKKMTFENWVRECRFNHSKYSIPELARAVDRDNIKITVLIPGKEVAKTIAKVLQVTVGPCAVAKSSGMYL